VQGVLASNTPDEIAGIVAHFRTAEVPLTEGHLSSPVGWVQALLPDGANLWFTAAITDAPMAARVRCGKSNPNRRRDPLSTECPGNRSHCVPPS
jgi:hypothetical protein